MSGARVILAAKVLPHHARTPNPPEAPGHTVGRFVVRES